MGPILRARSPQRLFQQRGTAGSPQKTPQTHEADQVSDDEAVRALRLAAQISERRNQRSAEKQREEASELEKQRQAQMVVPFDVGSGKFSRSPLSKAGNGVQEDPERQRRITEQNPKNASLPHQKSQGVLG
jgi:hypothetical protein